MDSDEVTLIMLTPTIAAMDDHRARVIIFNWYNNLIYITIKNIVPMDVLSNPGPYKNTTIGTNLLTGFCASSSEKFNWLFFTDIDLRFKMCVDHHGFNCANCGWSFWIFVVYTLTLMASSGLSNSGTASNLWSLTLFHIGCSSLKSSFTNNIFHEPSTFIESGS